MDGAKKRRLDHIYDYNKRPRSGNAVKSVDSGLFFLWNKILHKWSLKQKVNGVEHTVGHYRSESEGIRDARRIKNIKNRLRPGDLDRTDKYEREQQEQERKEKLDEFAEDQTQKVLYNSGMKDRTSMVIVGD